MGAVQESVPPAERPSRIWARNLVGAIALVEGAVAQHVLTALDTTVLRTQNAFGEPVGYERGEDVAALVRRGTELAEGGARVALIAPAADLAAARSELAALAARRLAVVVHAIAGPGS